MPHSHQSHALLAAFLFAFSGQSIAADSAPTTKPTNNQFAQLLGTMCYKFMAEMVERPDLQAVLRDRPVEVTSVCKCAEQEFAKDTKIKDFFDVPKAVLAEQMKSEHAKSYVMLRVASSLFGCLAPEFEKTLDASSPIARAPVTQTPTEQPSVDK